MEEVGECEKEDRKEQGEKDADISALVIKMKPYIKNNVPSAWE